MKKFHRLLSVIYLISFFAYSLNLPALVLEKKSPAVSKLINTQVPQASANFQFTPTEQTVTTSNGIVGNYLNTQVSDGSYFRVMNSTSGFDVTLTFNGMKLNNANRLVVKYDGSVSNAALTYQIQIRDFVNSTWRNIIPHDTTYTNTADSGSGLVLATATTGALSGGYFDIYNGYFSNGSNTPVSTPLSYFVNSSGQSQIRFVSAITTADLEMRIDYLALEASVSPQYLAASMTNTAGGTVTNEYNDTTSDDATTNLQIAANGSGIDAYLSFNEVALPYTDANTYLVEFSGLRTTITNYSLYLRDFTNSQWDLLNATALTSTSDATYYFALVPSTLTQNMSDYISNGEMRVRFNSASTSGSVTIDFVRLTIGSTATGSGNYVGNITKGTTSSGTIANTRTIDTSAADSAWVIASTLSDLRTTTEIAGDCNTPGTTNHCVGAQFTVPVTVPDNNVVQEVLSVVRFNTSNLAIDQTWTIRNFGTGWQDFTVAPADQSVATTMVRQLSNAMPPQLGAGVLTTIPTFTPNRYISDSINGITLRTRSTASDTTSRTVTVDFVFASIKSIQPQNKATHRYLASGGTITTGAQNLSNALMSNADDVIPWDLNPAGGGTDVYLSFTGITIPTGSNKIIITSKHRWDVSSATYEMYIYDFINTTWRELTPHDTNFTHDATAANYDFVQIEFFDGYIDNGSNAAVSTPIANFVSSGELRVRMLSSSATADLDWDFAQVQFAIDPTYHASSSTITTGTRANQYTDTYTDDNTTNYTITPSANVSDFYFSFTNVVTPAEGFNSVLLEVSAFQTAASSFNIEIRNFTTASWETIKSSYAVTADATHYFIKEIGDWSNYVSSGEMRVRFNTTGNANAVNVDFIQLTLGISPGSGSTVTSNYGAVMNGTASSLANADTVTSSNELNGTAYLTVTTANPTSGLSPLNGLEAKEIEVNLPIHIEPGIVPTGLIWAYRGSTSLAGHVYTPFIQEQGGHFRTLATSFLYTLPIANAMVAAPDTVTLASTTQAVRQGWYVELIEDLWKQTDNYLRFRLFSTTTTAAESKLNLDFVFVTYRWVPSETTPTPETQMRGGKWWFGGNEQKYSF